MGLPPTTRMHFVHHRRATHEYAPTTKQSLLHARQKWSVNAIDLPQMASLAYCIVPKLATRQHARWHIVFAISRGLRPTALWSQRRCCVVGMTACLFDRSQHRLAAAGCKEQRVRDTTPLSCSEARREAGNRSPLHREIQIEIQACLGSRTRVS